MVFENVHIKGFLEKFPRFKNSKKLKEAFELFVDDNEMVLTTGLFFGLANYFFEEMDFEEKSFIDERVAILAEIEDILNNFEKYPSSTAEGEFKHEACVSFLEGLQNRASNAPAHLVGCYYSKFIPYLGAKSKVFCKHWDIFTGVRSPGLWTDREWDSKHKR